MNKYKKKIGNFGEEHALKYLEKLGHILIERNYRKAVGEIDLITEKDKIIHFTEVKTVSRITDEDFDLEEDNDEDYRPEENLSEYKLRNFLRTIEWYLFEKEIFDVPFQINLITIKLLKKGETKIELFENVNL